MDTKKTARIVQYNAVHPKPRQRHTAEARFGSLSRSVSFGKLLSPRTHAMRLSAHA